ncbi:MAG: anti-sigma factor [Ardenticatenia bacterium]|nr:anti-sigma factor [Ardenticatenia bacterium]
MSLLGLLALGALPDEEARCVKFHVALCERCRAELARYEPLVEALLYQIPLVRAPERVRHRVATIPDLSPPSGQARQPPRRLSPRWFHVWAVAATFLLIVLGAWQVTSLGRQQELERQLVVYQEVVRLLVAALSMLHHSRAGRLRARYPRRALLP